MGLEFTVGRFSPIRIIAQRDGKIEQSAKAQKRREEKHLEAKEHPEEESPDCAK